MKRYKRKWLKVLIHLTFSPILHQSFSVVLKISALYLRTSALTHWGRVTHICVGNLIIIGSDNGLSPDQRQAIIWTNARILLIGPLGTNFSQILIEILTFSFNKMCLKLAKWRPFCLSLNVLRLPTVIYATRYWVTKSSAYGLAAYSGEVICWTNVVMSIGPRKTINVNFQWLI